MIPIFSVGGPNPKRLASRFGVEALQSRAGWDLTGGARHYTLNVVAPPPVRYLAVCGRVFEVVEEANGLVGPFCWRAFRRKEEEVVGIPEACNLTQLPSIMLRGGRHFCVISTLTRDKSRVICRTDPPTAMPDASAICSTAAASSKDARQICLIICLMALKALHPAVAPEPEKAYRNDRAKEGVWLTKSEVQSVMKVRARVPIRPA